LLDFPHYTRPAEYRGWGVPEVLIGGNHRRWRSGGAPQRWKKPGAIDPISHSALLAGAGSRERPGKGEYNAQSGRLNNREKTADEYPEADGKRCSVSMAAAAARAGDGSGFVCGSLEELKRTTVEEYASRLRLVARKTCDWRVRSEQLVGMTGFYRMRS